jgi:GDP-D-mannose dehydratase
VRCRPWPSGPPRSASDPRYERLAEVDALIEDTSKASRQLGWQPSVLVPELAQIMVDAEMVAIGGTELREA